MTDCTILSKVETRNGYCNDHVVESYSPLQGGKGQGMPPPWSFFIDQVGNSFTVIKSMSDLEITKNYKKQQLA